MYSLFAFLITAIYGSLVVLLSSFNNLEKDPVHIKPINKLSKMKKHQMHLRNKTYYFTTGSIRRLKVTFNSSFTPMVKKRT